MMQTIGCKLQGQPFGADPTRGVVIGTEKAAGKVEGLEIHGLNFKRF
jgi:hypothetical protein